ncbi:MAG: hypothetical protein RIN56_06805 [Sporomusaceae bacterium]|nr:hypothetical protein [Sporomusaceae bacterium]
MMKTYFDDKTLGWLLVGALAVMTWAAWSLPKGWNLFGVTVALVFFLMLHGLHSNGKPLGILIGNRNMMSLSRFQAVLWTIIVLAAYITIVFVRIRAGSELVPEPLAVEIDWRLWALMGISYASSYFSPLIVNNKAVKATPSDEEVERIATKFDLKADEVKSASNGVVYANPDISQADLADMFEGDEIGDAAYVDISKVQMFLFTVVAVISYEALVINTIMTVPPDKIVSFPALSEGFLAILGISHAGYLSSKTVTSTKIQ